MRRITFSDSAIRFGSTVFCRAIALRRRRCKLRRDWVSLPNDRGANSRLFLDCCRARGLLGMGAIRAVRHRSPPVRGRIVAPHLWPLGPVLMPRPRLEKAELFVVHLI